MPKNSEKLTTSASEPAEIPANGELVIYSAERGVRAELRFEGETFWATQAQIAGLFARNVSSISRHISNIFEDGELQEVGNLQKVQIARSAKPVALYSLDVIISVGYRVTSSIRATQFRIWATQVLREYLVKGFALDDERLKSASGNDHFAELRERIRDIRASEVNLYREVREICSLCDDYATQSGKAKGLFFASMQNMLHYSVTSMEAAETIIARADAAQPNMGLQSWEKDRPIQKDALVAKNYLGQDEIRDLNRFTGMLLDYFEQETDLRRLVSMSDAGDSLTTFITNNKRPLLRRPTVSKAAGEKHVKAQYKIFNEARRSARLATNDADIAELVKQDRALLAAPRPRGKKKS